MWEIYEHRTVSKRLSRLPVEILKRYEKWKDIVQISGSDGLAAIKGFHDEALHGQMKGHRSSRLGLQYRVIYKVEESESVFLVMNITAHDYRKK
ncbi:type II toxin-antitoxin system mRNA interferase toxin, RelE/StbE family [Gemmatimonadota bacterium]